jgi:hypothetical protein
MYFSGSELSLSIERGENRELTNTRHRETVPDEVNMETPRASFSLLRTEVKAGSWEPRLGCGCLTNHHHLGHRSGHRFDRRRSDRHRCDRHRSDRHRSDRHRSDRHRSGHRLDESGTE